MIKEIRYVYQQKSFFGMTNQTEERAYGSVERLKKCFAHMHKNPYTTALWVNFGDYSEGYWYDSVANYEQGIIKVTISSNIYHSTDCTYMPVRKAKKKLYEETFE